MKIVIALFCAVAVCLSLCACTCDAGKVHEDDVAHTLETLIQPVSKPLPTESESKYGDLQKIVDSFGFPIHFRMTEGMELTTIELTDNYAKRKWISSLSDHAILHENLEWSITGDHLIISGEWNQEFTIDAEAGRAYSKSDGKEYRIVTYDDEGEVDFYVE